MLPITDPILVFAILGFSILLGLMISARVRIPDLVLLIGFGALLGPHGFHVLERNESVTLLGAVGLLYIMFLAGIEIDLYRFSRSYKRSIFFGLLTFIIPQSLGTLAGYYILGLSWPASLLLASMFASHTLLAYPLASRLGISRSEPVAITVGATIITDTLALLVLAVIADSARGDVLGAGFWATLVLGMFLLTVFIWKGVPWGARWFFRQVTEKSNAQFLFVVVTVCVCAYLSHFARVEPIIGAFLAGAAFNRLIPENSPLMGRVTFAGHTLFIPFFLISVGMMVDLRAMLTGPRSWLVGVTMVIAVVVTKYAAARLTRLAFGYSRAAGRVMFGLSVVQAAATLAAVVVGFDLGILDDYVLNGAILMILATCLLGSWMVDRYGRQMAAETPLEVSKVEKEQRILIPVANPESAIELLDLAFSLRNTVRPGGIFPLTIVRDQDNTEEVVAEGEKLLGYCLAHAASADIPVNPSLRVAVNISDSIVHAATEIRADSVLVGWQGKQSASVRIFGSKMHHLVANCSSRLLFCRLLLPLNTTERLIMLFPPLASQRRDIFSLLSDAKLLTHRIGAHLRLITVRKEADSLQKLIENAKPSCPTSTVILDSWDQMRQSLSGEIKKNDMILLPAARRSDVLWTPALDHLPEWLAEQFPETNLLVAYPSQPVEYRTPQETEGEQDEEGPLLLPVNLEQGTSLEDAIRQMAEAVFSELPGAAKALTSHLLATAVAYPVELAPGIVLLHTRFGDFKKPVLLICHAREGCRVPHLPTPPNVILLLLGAKTLPPEQHLKTLSFIAKRMHHVKQNGEYGLVDNAEQFSNLFKKSL